MTDIIKYFENNQVRIHLDERDKLWFCGMDACHILTIENHKDAVSGLPERQKRLVGTTDPSGRVRKTLFVNLSGLLRLIFKSRKPEAERLQDWTFDEVLPEILKTGTYGMKKPSAATSLRAAEAIFKVALRIAKLLKLDEAKAIVSANSATEQLTGCNLLNLLTVTGIPSKPPAEEPKPNKEPDKEPVKKAEPAEQQNTKRKKVCRGAARQEQREREKREEKLVQEQIDLMQSNKKK